MSAEDNKSAVLRFFDEARKGELASVDTLCAPNFVYHSPTYGDMDLERYKEFCGSLLRSYPDYARTVEDLLAAEGDKVVVRMTDRGTDLGGSPTLGTPPTGKQIAMTAMAIIALENGKIAEIWALHDMLGAMKQLGLLPGRG